jgi:CDP-paratose 2-epimerase
MKLLVTGCCGLVGSAVVDLLCRFGHEVVGVDNDGRKEFFGPAASTAKVGLALEYRHGLNFRRYGTDVRDTAGVFELVEFERPFDAVVHCAAQPSHDWAAEHPLDDFHVNAFATVKLLEACRRNCPEAVFVFMSTNKIYGAELSGVGLVERETRLEFAGLEHGVNETFSVDQCTRSLYGVGKLAADAATQEYGRYFGMRTVCLRAGCITGAGHAAVSLHGFLSYVVKCNLTGTPYVVKGFGGKQVRDNIHAVDLAELIGMMIERPSKPGSVYNVGGGKANSCSILEAFAAVEALTDRPMIYSHDPVPRIGDHACYYTDLRAVRSSYPDWQIRRGLPAIYEDLVADWMVRG